MTPMRQNTSATPGPKEVTMAHLTTITESQASEPGALDGFDINCDVCGFVGGYSLLTLAQQNAAGHVRYFSQKEGK